VFNRRGPTAPTPTLPILQRALITLAAVLAAAAAAAVPTMAADEVTTPQPGQLYDDGHVGRYLLDGPWWFRLDPRGIGVRAGFAHRSQLAGWSPIQVPYAWNANDESIASMRGTIGWYRKDFRLPSAPRGTQWIVRFESVNYRAKVYLNGHLIGRHESPSIPFELLLGKYAKRGVNSLVVRADSRRSLSTLPPLKISPTTGLPSAGWWNYGGILREVYLRPVSTVDMTDFLARPSLPCRRCDASVLLRATLRNMTRKKVAVQTRASVGGVAGRFPKVTLPPYGVRDVATKVKIRNPRLWEPLRPQLYSVSASARAGRGPVAAWSARIGIRSIRVSRTGRVLVNGLPVQLRGASFHEENLPVGAALTPQMRIDMFQDLLDLGASLTRAHYPVHPAFMEMADRAGMFVWDEIPAYQWPNSVTAKASVRAKGLRYLAATVARDQNHPSVLAWAIGNEMPTRVGTGQQKYIRDAARLLGRLDPTRLRALDYAGYPNSLPSSTYHVLDALGVNCYFGWYPGPGGQVDDRAVLPRFLDQVHGYYPSKALFVTEFGAEANRNGPFDEKGTFSFQRQLIEDHLAVYDSKPFVNGALVWALRDFRVRPHWDGGNPKPASPLNQKGLMDQFGRPKPAFAAVKRMFAELDPIASASRAGRRAR
jgi:beta-glucuronidase